MSSTVELLEAQVIALKELDGRIPGGIDGIRVARDPELLEFLRCSQSVVRLAQAAVAAASGEIARRSEYDGDGSLARRAGERSAVGLVAKQAGVSTREAVSIVKVGEAIRPREALSGEELQPERPRVAGALASGRLSVPLAELIQDTLAKLAPVLWADQAEELESKLVRMATEEGWSVTDFTRYCRRIPDHLDPDGAAPREEDLRRLAAVRETRLPNGLLRVTADLHPELEGWWKAAMAAKTGPRRRARFGDLNREPSETDRLQPDRMQAKLEALTTILRQSLQGDDGQAAGVDVTMLVTIDLDKLLAGVGEAHIAGVDEPISAATARRLAAQADLIPQVLNGRSVVLDQGLAKRIFTKHQRYALATRDQGCTFPGCPLPPGMCEVNHVGKWRHRKPTDLNNGALLCGWHNRLMEQGWAMELRDDIPWFIPPATIDPTRTPLRGGKPRLAEVA